MELKLFATVSMITLMYFAAAKTGSRVSVPTRFSCQGRSAGYYADIDTGCQVYHMCDGLGRQFSYSCPNTTLFQQRMLICDHWYMVNCSNSEDDYDANLLIGQRDKPFVSDEDMRQRTPRPDILSVPPNNNFFDGLKEAESKFSLHQSNSISDDDDTISSANNNDLDNDKPKLNHIPSESNHGKKSPISSNGFNNNHNSGAAFNVNRKDNVEEESSSSRTIVNTYNNKTYINVSTPSSDLIPPLLPPTTTEAASDEFQIDVRLKPTSDPVFNFIKRFDPNSPDSLNTSMSKSEIIDINKHLPAGQSSAEDERIPRKNKNFGNNFNVVKSGNKKGATDESRFNTANVKTFTESETANNSNQDVIVPSQELLPPKTDYLSIASTTMGPPIYFEWKWAVPALDLETPKIGNYSLNNATNKVPVKLGKRPFNIPRTTTQASELKTKNVEYNISSYFVPDYVFPLDGAHPGYDSDDAQTSFQVHISRPGRASYGENPKCPHCHPAYLTPGTCEPCIIKR